jgi:hypothetical protein
MTISNRNDNVMRQPALPASFARDMVRRQMNRSGNTLLASIEPLDDDDFYKAFANGSSIAWTVGHLACVLDLFSTWLGAPGKALPAEMHDVFNRLDLGTDEPNPPSKAESVDRKTWGRKLLITRLREAQVRVLTILDSFDSSRWYERSPASAPDTLPTLGDIWESLCVHTFWHLGEISGAHPRFKGTYTLNTVLHYFHVDSPQDAALARNGGVKASSAGAAAQATP